MNFDTLTDEYILREIQRGSIEYFKIIVARYEEKIFNIGMRFFYNRDDSMDFTQEVFIRLFDKIDKYRETAPFRFWFYKLAYNYALNLKKKISKVHLDSDCDDVLIKDFDSMPEKILSKKSVKEILLGAIEKLPDRYKICLDFYFFMGLKYTQISEITGYPVNTIKSDVLRAKKILRANLKGTEAEVCDEM